MANEQGLPTSSSANPRLSTFFITHRNLRRNTPIYNITSHLTSPPTSVTHDIRDQVSTIVKTLKHVQVAPEDDGKQDLAGSSSDEESTHKSKPSTSTSASTSGATYTVRRPKFWSKDHIVANAANKPLCTFNPPIWWTPAPVDLFFSPDGAKHCGHDIRMAPVDLMRRAEEFVVDSATYTWRLAGVMSIYDYTLYKNTGRKEGAGYAGGELEGKAVAKYSQLGVMKKGGVFVVDTSEVDEVVAMSTALIVLWKIMMRGC